MAELLQYELGQVCSRLSSGKSISAERVRSSGKYPVYGGNGLRGYTDEANFKGDCAIIGRQGAFCGNVRYFHGVAYMTEHAVVVCADEQNDTRYLAYLLSTMNLGHLSGQSAQPGLSVKTLAKQAISLPSLKEQKRIASFLGALDERIELNALINNHLEQMAQALFKSWFVDFEPFGGMMPDDWREGTLDDLCSLVAKGITPKYDDNSDEIVINQKCIRHRSIDMTLARRHKPKAINEKWLRFGDILINSTGEGTLGRAAQFLSDASNVVVDSHVTIVRPKEGLLIPYLGLWCLSRESLFASMSSGSTGQTDLPRERLKALPVLVPDMGSLQEFRNIIFPLRQKRVATAEESSNLATLRDSLLPRLMSGELSVSDVDAK